MAASQTVTMAADAGQVNRFPTNVALVLASNPKDPTARLRKTERPWGVSGTKEAYESEHVTLCTLSMLAPFTVTAYCATNANPVPGDRESD